MNLTVDGKTVHYAEHGEGIPVFAIHGWFSGHQEIEGFLEAFFADRPGFRRIYPDLPGMGQTPADGINSSDDSLALMLGLIDGLVGDAPFLLVGHSYGGYMARAIAYKRPQQTKALALLNPLMSMGEDDARQVAEFQVMAASNEVDGVLPPELDLEYRSYMVIQTPETLKTFQERLMPVMQNIDHAGLERIGANWKFTTDPECCAPYENPALILTGRQDSTVGYADQWTLVPHYPRATFAALDFAGHALPHEQPALLGVFMADWLQRAGV